MNNNELWSTHVTVKVIPGGQEIYERWKIMEGTAQLSAPGFVKRTLLRSRTDATVYYYQSFWRTEEDSTNFARTAAFAELAQRYDPRPVFAAPMQREDCDIVIDETASAAQRAGWVVHAVVQLQPGNAELYQQWKLAEGELRAQAAGFLQRTLLRSRQEALRYFNQSFWVSRENYNAFTQAPEYQALLLRFPGIAEVAAAMLHEECAVIFAEVATIQAA